MMEVALWGHGWLDSGIGLRVHSSPAVVDREPVRSMLSKRVTVIWYSVKMVVHPWSHG
jgi:hypothetical protein